MTAHFAGKSAKNLSFFECLQVLEQKLAKTADECEENRENVWKNEANLLKIELDRQNLENEQEITRIKQVFIDFYH